MNWQPIPAQPTGAGAYSRAIRAGDFVFVSGQVPRDPQTNETVGTTVAEQTRVVIDRLEEALAPAGATLRDLVSVNVYLADINSWGEFNEAYRERMPAPYPTRTTVGAALHGFLVEISGIAYLPSD